MLEKAGSSLRDLQLQYRFRISAPPKFRSAPRPSRGRRSLAPRAPSAPAPPPSLTCAAPTHRPGHLDHPHGVAIEDHRLACLGNLRRLPKQKKHRPGHRSRATIGPVGVSTREPIGGGGGGSRRRAEAGPAPDPHRAARVPRGMRRAARCDAGLAPAVRAPGGVNVMRAAGHRCGRATLVPALRRRRAPQHRRGAVGCCVML